MRAAACAIGCVLIAAVAPAQAEPVADFYRGKSIRMLIGYGPGGGYDIYGRLVAEFLPRHLSGNPTIVPQNMPGAGSFVAAKYMAEVAPRDGTVLGSLSQMLALDSMIGNVAKADISKFAYLGRVVTNVDVGLTLLKSGIKSFEDARKKEYTVGASGGGSRHCMRSRARQKSDALSSQRQEYRRTGSTPCVRRSKICSMTLPSWLPLKSGT
jgi:tripartite-type tricarboxylate transporter receptor subunit TctC